MDTVIPFMAVACDNLTSSSQTYYIHVNRGTCEGTMYFSLSMNERIKTGRGVFSFSGTASNPGNSSISLSGVDSSVLTLNLANNTTIPPEAIVTSVNTSGTQSPSQGNVHHMVLPATESSTWYTSTVASASSGHYNIDVSDGFQAAQRWQFKYNALATAKSTMKNVKITLEWEYDIANTGYKNIGTYRKNIDGQEIYVIQYTSYAQEDDIYTILAIWRTEEEIHLLSGVCRYEEIPQWHPVFRSVIEGIKIG